MKEKRKIRIAILTHNYPTDSKERKNAGIFIYDFAQELSKVAEVFIFCPDSGGQKENYKKVPVTWFLAKGVRGKLGDWQLFNPRDVYRFIKLMIVGKKEAIRFVKTNKIDYCLACWSLPSAVFAYFINRRTGIPYATWSLGSDINKYASMPMLGSLIGLSMKKAEVCYANSYALTKKIRKLFRRNCIFLPAVTDFGDLTAKDLRGGGPFRFLFVGRMETIKGPDVLLKAVTSGMEKYSYRVEFLGDGNLRERLEKNATGYSNLSFHGWANKKKVSSFMKKSDCLVVPSRSESLPLVIIEAAQYRLPVIASDVGDCRRMVNRYKIGAVAKKGDPKALRKAMVDMISGKIKTDEKGFDRLLDDFSLKKAVRDFYLRTNR